MQPVENSVFFVRIINSPKFIKANQDLIKNKILSTVFLGVKTIDKTLCNHLYLLYTNKDFQKYKYNHPKGKFQKA